MDILTVEKMEPDRWGVWRDKGHVVRLIGTYALRETAEEQARAYACVFGFAYEEIEEYD